MKRLLVIVLLFVVSVATSQTNVSGIISQNTTWAKSGSPYIVTNNLLVSTGVKLTVESGVTVKIKGGKTLQVLGELNAIGTQNDSIIITDFDQTSPFKSLEFGDSSEDVLFNSDGSWASGNILKFVKVLGGGENANGSVIFASSTGLIENSTVASSNSSGIYLYKNTSHVNNGWMGSGSSSSKSVHVVSSEIFSNNSNGFSCSCYQYNIGIIISDSKLNYNGGSGFTSGGGDHGGSHEFIITNNQFSYNQNKGYEGLTNGLQIVNGNRINNNGSIGVRLRGHGPYKIRSNYILYNAGGVDGDYTGIEIDSNVIAYNDWAIKSRAGGYFKIRGNQIIENGSSGIYASIYDPSSSWGKPVDIKRNSFIGNQSDSALIATINPNQGSYTFTIDSNNFGGNESKYYIYNTRAFSATNGVDATYNYFNGNDVTSMSDSIYDWSDNGSLSIVSLTNVSSTVNSFAPVLPPKKVFIYPGTNDYIVVEADLPSDFSNYRLYKGDCLFTDFTNDSTQLSNFNVDSIGYYSLTVRSNSASGCEDFFTGEESFHFTDIKLPFDLKTESSLCFDDSLSIFVERNSADAAQAEFVVVISDSSTVILTDTIAPGVSNFNWSPADSLRTDQEYSITLSSSDFSYSRTSSVRFLDKINYTISRTGDIASCPMVQQTLNAPSGLTNITWYSKQSYNTWGGFTMENDGSSITASGGVSYYFTATSQEGCVNYSDTLDLMIVGLSGNPPSISSSVPVTYCDGAPFNLSCFIPTNHISLNNYKGGVSPLSAIWFRNDTIIDSVLFDHAMPNNFTLTDSVPGTYKLRIGSNSCYEESTLTMTGLPNVDISVNSTLDNTCYGDSDGVIIVSSQTANNYSWTNSQYSNLPNNDTLTNLLAGNYSLTVSRSNGCSKSVLITINEPDQIQITGTTQPVSCYSGNDGVAQISVNNAVAPYVVSWQNMVSSSDSIFGLTAGNYQVTVTDSNGCSNSQSIVVNEPDVLSISIAQQSNVSCKGGLDGSVSVSITGGNGGYSVSCKDLFSGLTIGTSSAIQGLASGTYRFYVSDLNGCSDSLDVEITEPQMVLSASVTNHVDVLCYGEMTGSLAATAMGGTVGQGYSFSWSNSSGTVVGSNSILNQIGSDVYSCLVVDQNGCSTVVYDTIYEPLSPISLTNKGYQNVACFGGSDGLAWVSPAGGIAPYSYVWDNGNLLDSANSLSAGTYTVNVMDQNGCVDTAMFSITEPTLITHSITKSNYNGNTAVSCPGGSDGHIDLTVTGGVGNYSYQWSNSYNSQDISNLVEGQYYCLITDGNGCSDSVSVYIDDPVDISWSVLSQDIDCFGGSTGSIDLDLNGGNAPYVVNWTFSNAIPKSSVTFQVDMSNESLSTLGVGAAFQGTLGLLGMTNYYGDSVFIASKKFNVGDTIFWRYFNGSNPEQVPVSCGANTAQSIFERFLIVPSKDTILPLVCFSSCINCDGNISQGNSGVITSANSEINGLSSGIYSAVITDANGCSVNYIDTVSEPSAIITSLDSIFNATCPQNADGYIGISVTGGTGNYTFDWSSGDTGQFISVGYGTYYLVVSDGNLCMDSSSYFIDAPFPYNDEEICVVTVDTTGVNMVVWEKTPNVNTSEYRILRENASSQYVGIGSTQYLDFSSFIDQNSNPKIQPYRYRITLLDSCGNYSDTSDYHSTIHLQASQGVAQNEVQLQWTHYEGKQVQTYYIYRWLNPVTRVLIDSVSSNVSTYTDIYPVNSSTTALLYEVSAKFYDDSCLPTSGKTTVLNQSFSNRLDWGTEISIPFGITEGRLLNGKITVYPNPTSGNVSIVLDSYVQWDEELVIQIVNSVGQIVKVLRKDSHEDILIDLSGLAQGVYIVKVISPSGLVGVESVELID